MVNLQKIIVVLLIITLIMSVASIAFNIVVYKMKSSNDLSGNSIRSNVGNIGFVVEGINNGVTDNG